LTLDDSNNLGLGLESDRDVIVVSRRKPTRDLWPDLTAKRETYIPAIAHEEAG
jgi:hypothetical protein